MREKIMKNKLTLTICFIAALLFSSNGFAETTMSQEGQYIFNT